MADDQVIAPAEQALNYKATACAEDTRPPCGRTFPSRRGFLKAAGATVLLARAGAAANSKPNVLILMVDEHNPFYSSTYGDRYKCSIATPNMDRLAQMGTVFENAYCPSPLCTPSRSAFMSGRWVHEIQAYNNVSVRASHLSGEIREC